MKEATDSVCTAGENFQLEEKFSYLGSDIVSFCACESELNQCLGSVMGIMATEWTLVGVLKQRLYSFGANSHDRVL